MNRKQRRAATKRGGDRKASAGSAGSSFRVAELFAAAVGHHQAGRLVEAEDLFRQICTIDPNHAGSVHQLGLIAHRLGRNDAARELIARAVALEPNFPEAHNNLGNLSRKQGRLEEAVEHYARALALKPSYVLALHNLAGALVERGRLGEAVEHYRRALALEPDHVLAHNDLARALRELGRMDEAELHYARAVVLAPDFAEAHYNLGLALLAQGKFAAAAPRFERALALKPDFIEAYDNLGRVFLSQDRLDDAMGVLRHALARGATPDTKSLFVECARLLTVPPDLDDFRELMIRALSEPWSRPGEVGAIVCALFERDATIRRAVEWADRARAAGHPGHELPEPAILAALAEHRLLRCLLEATPIHSIALERLLTDLRGALLVMACAAPASGPVESRILQLCCALARQCFLNEYVFAAADDEIDRASRLRDSLSSAVLSGGVVSELWLAMVAAYFPLHTLPVAGDLLGKTWSKPVAELLVVQVREPDEERQLRPGIPALTVIENEVSLLVQRQYEENPYPRWVKAQPPLPRATINQFLRSKFPLAPFHNLESADIDILIAGCGTGQHSVETAQRFPRARVLAVDLSLASLAYAARKTRALGIGQVEYAQADILALPTLGRTFDVVEAGGVLHHLADPLAGWRVLLSLLRPGGFMGVGLYSRLAREQINAARTFIAERRFGSSARDIQRCRQELMNLPDGTAQKGAVRRADFFSASACRDLLFHVQEHQMTVPQIAGFLAEHDLGFLGFDLDAAARARYRTRFPDDPAMTDLDRWHAFERENPDTFAGMYQFWVRKGIDRA